MRQTSADGAKKKDKVYIDGPPNFFHLDKKLFDQFSSKFLVFPRYEFNRFNKNFSSIDRVVLLLPHPNFLTPSTVISFNLRIDRITKN